MEKANITIIGAGVVGLAVASKISEKFQNVYVIEKHSTFGIETSSRSSEVIHAGIYYPQNSFKGRFCTRGNELMYQICDKYNVPYINSGKLLIASTPQEVALLPEMFEKSKNNGAKNVRMVDENEIKKIEPNVEALAAIYYPSSGTVDSHRLMMHFESKSIEQGVNFVYNTELLAVEKGKDAYLLVVKNPDDSQFRFLSNIVINCAGLFSQKVAESAGFDTIEKKYRLVYRKGIYYRVNKQLEKYPKTLIYPTPPDPGSIGIHTTLDLSGGMRLGPYIGDEIYELDYNIDDELHQLFYESAKLYLPFLEYDDISADSAGILPQLQKPFEPMRDFIIKNEYETGMENFINLIGIESPGLTAAPAIAEYIPEIII